MKIKAKHMIKTVIHLFKYHERIINVFSKDLIITQKQRFSG